MRSLARRFVPIVVASVAALAVGAHATTTSTPANHNSMTPALSADGRYVAFKSKASNLVPNDTNRAFDTFVRDRATRTTERVSVSSAGEQAGPQDFLSGGGVAITPDGRYVVFESEAPNLVPGDTNKAADVFVRDRTSKTTERVNVTSAGAQGNSFSYAGTISADGRYVTFWSPASNLVAGDTKRCGRLSCLDVFVRDRVSGTTTRVSVGANGAQGNNDSAGGAISGDGRLVAFWSRASNLVAGDTNRVGDVFVRDLEAGTTTRVDVSSRGGQANDQAGGALISADGRVVTFSSDASNLVAGDTNKRPDTFVRDLRAGRTERVSVNGSGRQADRYSEPLAINANGRLVVLWSTASNLVRGDTNRCVDRMEGTHYNCSDIFVRDRVAHTTTRVSVSTTGIQGDENSTEVDQEYVGSAAISADGRFVAFTSRASNLVTGDTNRCSNTLGERHNCSDVFLRDRLRRTTTLVSVGR